MNNKQLNRQILARLMLATELPRAGIRIHLGLTKRQIEVIADEQGSLPLPDKKKKMRKPGDIIETRHASAEAALFFPIYTQLMEQNVHDDIDYMQFCKAYSIYIDVREDAESKREGPLPPGDMWCLINGLIQEEAMMEKCNHCHTWSYIALDQKIRSACAICPPAKQSPKSFF